ncbi:MAG: sulfite exporter TauE/SafE family protein [Chloroflexota bacterium]
MTIGLLMVAGGVAAGVFGSLLGLGGGILIVPLLTIGFNLPLREAVGVSLICVIVTSGASAGVYLERHVANLRLGMTLELFTAIGALFGGLVAFLLPDRVLAGLFAVLLVYVAVTMLRRRDPGEEAVSATANDDEPAPRHPFGLPLDGPGYRVHSVGRGVVGSLFAGVVSALLGIGGGLIKVPVMNLIMGVPLRIATATSNLMIGVTASASAIIYLLRGGIDSFVAGPTAIGVFIGASIGSRTAHRVDLRILRILFVAVLGWTAFEMARRALGI